LAGGPARAAVYRKKAPACP